MDGGETGGAADEERPRESAAEQQAHDELQRQVEADKAKAVGLLNVYTTQLSSKKPGLRAAGRTWTYETILGQYRELKAKYPNALLVWGPDYTNYSPLGAPLGLLRHAERRDVCHGTGRERLVHCQRIRQ